MQPEEVSAAYNCLIPEMREAYARSGIAPASYDGMSAHSRTPYISDTHGGRFVMNYANAAGKAYGKYEEAGRLPNGTVLYKDSFTIDGGGRVAVGPLFVMTKMEAGFDAASGDWKYSMVMPDGSIFGETNGRNAAGMQFCVDCHAAAAETDYLMFMPEEARLGK